MEERKKEIKKERKIQEILLTCPKTFYINLCCPRGERRNGYNTKLQL